VERRLLDIVQSNEPITRLYPIQLPGDESEKLRQARGIVLHTENETFGNHYHEFGNLLTDVWYTSKSTELHRNQIFLKKKAGSRSASLQMFCILRYSRLIRQQQCF
jgi:hypothetical protein